MFNIVLCYAGRAIRAIGEGIGGLIKLLVIHLIVDVILRLLGL